jgi:hypothetical protein
VRLSRIGITDRVVMFADKLEPTLAQSYKTFYARNLQIYVLSSSACPRLGLSSVV